MDRPIAFWHAVREDALAHVPAAKRPEGKFGRLRCYVRVLASSAGFRCVLCYRLSHLARRRLGLPGRVLSAFLFWVMRHGYGCSIAATAELHGGLILPHPQGIVIGAEVTVGPRAWIFQNVTLGGAPGKSGQPRVGADVRLYAGAVVAGPVRVGDEVVIGANVVVSRDVPDRATVRAAECVIRVEPHADTFDRPARNGTPHAGIDMTAR